MWWNVPAQTCAACGPDQRFEPADHLAGRPAGEGDQQDRLGRHAPGDQVGDAVGDDPRLARARARPGSGCSRRGPSPPRAGRRSGRAAKCSARRSSAGLLEPDLPHGRVAGPRVASAGRGSIATVNRYYTVRRARVTPTAGLDPDLTPHRSPKRPRPRMSTMRTRTDHVDHPRPQGLPRRPPDVDDEALAAFLADHDVEHVDDRHRGRRREAGRGRRPALLHVVRQAPAGRQRRLHRPHPRGRPRLGARARGLQPDHHRASAGRSRTS